MPVLRVSPLLAALLLALLVATPLACGVGLPDGLPVGNPDELEEDPLGEPLNLEDDGDVSMGFRNDLDLAELQDPEVDPIELAGAFEGDIILANEEQLRLINDSLVGGPVTHARNAIIKQSQKWPGAVIPYVIGSSFNANGRAAIAAAMRKYHAETCIKFVPRSNHRNYIHIYRGGGCSSMVGRQGGRQMVSLGNGCLHQGVIMHELMHAAGFWHEQSRYDRDSYIRINWGNIIRGMEYNFQKYDWNTISHLGQPYDLSSIMHYGSKAFTRDYRLTTIDALNGASMGNIGQRRGFSTIDRKKLNKLYSCSGTTTTTTTTTGGGCADKNTKCAAWAKIGECSKNPAYMHVSCKKSCNKCKTSKNCTNNNQYCDDWASKGECKKNPAYMLVSCKKACKGCS